MPVQGTRGGGKSGHRGGKGFHLATRSGSHAYKGRGMTFSHSQLTPPIAIDRDLTNTNNIFTAQKIKDQLVHKAKVKKDYYKQLSKEDSSLETPDYVKEVSCL
jgi:hypothetical protein